MTVKSAKKLFNNFGIDYKYARPLHFQREYWNMYSVRLGPRGVPSGGKGTPLIQPRIVAVKPKMYSELLMATAVVPIIFATDFKRIEAATKIQTTFRAERSKRMVHFFLAPTSIVPVSPVSSPTISIGIGNGVFPYTSPLIMLDYGNWDLLSELEEGLGL